MDPSARTLAGEIRPAEYARLLGLPRGLHRPPLQAIRLALASFDESKRARDEYAAHTGGGEFRGVDFGSLIGPLVAERAEWAAAWYAENGRPWVAARRVPLDLVDGDTVALAGGHTFRSRSLADRLRAGEAHALVALGVTAGREVDAESQQLWQDGRVDEAFFLDRFGAAVAEHLVSWTSVRVCRHGEPAGETALPHLSPGCGGWDFEDQPHLMRLLAGGDASGLGPLVLLSSGMMTPKNSLLAAMGMTRRVVAPTPADACRGCDLSPCDFRRAPYRGAA